MYTTITTSPHEIWTLVLAICAAIITISGAVTAITAFITKARAPEKTQNERIEKLEKKVEAIDERLHRGSDRFAQDSERVEALETNIRQTNKIIVEGLQTLIAHAIDGNNEIELKNAKHKLDEYLISRM